MKLPIDYLRAVFFLISPKFTEMTYNPSQIIMTFLYVLPYYAKGKNVAYFGSIMFSFRFIALTISQIQGAFLIIDFVFS